MKKFLALTMVLAALLCSCGGGAAGGEGAGETAALDVNVDEVVNAALTTYGLVDGFVFTSSSTELGEYLDDDLIMDWGVCRKVVVK